MSPVVRPARSQGRKTLTPFSFVVHTRYHSADTQRPIEHMFIFILFFEKIMGSTERVRVGAQHMPTNGNQSFRFLKTEHFGGTTHGKITKRFSCTFR